MAKFFNLKYLCKKKSVTSENLRVYEIYFETQFQIEIRTFTGTDISGKEEQDFFSHSKNIMKINSLCF